MDEIIKFLKNSKAWDKTITTQNYSNLQEKTF